MPFIVMYFNIHRLIKTQCFHAYLLPKSKMATSDCLKKNKDIGISAFLLSIDHIQDDGHHNI